MTVVAVIAHALLGGGALLALVRLARGPSLLDRVVATDTLLVIISASLAVHAALAARPDGRAGAGRRLAAGVRRLGVDRPLRRRHAAAVGRDGRTSTAGAAEARPMSVADRRRRRRRDRLPAGRGLPVPDRGRRAGALPRRPVADARGHQAAGARHPAGDGRRRDPAARAGRRLDAAAGRGLPAAHRAGQRAHDQPGGLPPPARAPRPAPGRRAARRRGRDSVYRGDEPADARRNPAGLAESRREDRRRLSRS